MIRSLNRNLFGFPFGAVPGFDSQHPGVPGDILPFSVAQIGAGSLYITSPKKGTVVSTPGRATDPLLGPVITIVGDSTAAITWPYLATGNNPAFTLGAIFRPTGSFGVQRLIACSANVASQGLGLSIDSSQGNILGVFWGGAVTQSTGIVAVSGKPYFFAATGPSGTAVTCFWVIVELDTGRFYQGKLTSPGTVGGSSAAGTAVFGNRESRGFGGNIACASISFKTVSFGNLLLWAKDPWSYWYPRASTQRVGIFVPPPPDLSLVRILGMADVDL